MTESKRHSATCTIHYAHLYPVRNERDASAALRLHVETERADYEFGFPGRSDTDTTFLVPQLLQGSSIRPLRTDYRQLLGLTT